MHEPSKKYLFDNLPEFYKTFDKNENNLLERTLSVIENNGIAPIINSLDKIIDLIDVDNCPKEYLEYLFNQLGIPYEPDIPEEFQRIILKNGSILNQRKGTITSIEYLVNELSGSKCDIDIYKLNGKKYIRIVFYIFEEGESKFLVTQGVISKYIKKFIPVLVDYELLTSYMFSDAYNKQNITYNETLINMKENNQENKKNISIYTEIIEIDIPDNEEIQIPKNIYGITNSYESRTNLNFYTNLESHYDKIL